MNGFSLRRGCAEDSGLSPNAMKDLSGLSVLPWLWHHQRGFLENLERLFPMLEDLEEDCFPQSPLPLEKKTTIVRDRQVEH